MGIFIIYFRKNFQYFQWRWVYLGHFFSGVTATGLLSSQGLKFFVGELSPQTTSFIHFSLWSLFSVTLMSYSYYFGYQNSCEVQNTKIQQLMLELGKKNELIDDYQSKLDNLEEMDHEQAHPNTPTSTHSETESYEILSMNGTHYKAN